MNHTNPRERDSFPLLSKIGVSRIRGGKPPVDDSSRTLQARFAPLARSWQRAMPAGTGIYKEFWSKMDWTKDPELISYALSQTAPWVVFLGSLLVYILTVAPTVFGYDSAEYVSAAYNLGVPHPTGYPSYVIVGKVFSYLPFSDDVAYRLNVLSAVLAAGTATLVYLLSFLITRRLILSVAVAGFLAFSFWVWSAAVIAEVYSLHSILTAAIIYLLLLWVRGGSNKLIYGAALLWGFSFGNHMTTVLMGPAFAFLVALGVWNRRLGWQNLLALAGCVVIPLTVYVHLPLVYLSGIDPYALGQFDDQGVWVKTDTTTLEGMWEALTASQFDLFFFNYHGMEFVHQLGQVMFWVYANFLGVGLALGILGILRNYVVDKLRLVFLGLVFLSNMLFFASYGATDRQFMILVLYVVWSLWIADGLCYLIDSLGKAFPLESGERLTAVLGQRVSGVHWERLSLALPIAALWVNFSYADLSSYTYIRDTYPEIMESFEPNALVLAWWPDSSPMYYFQQVDKVREDILIIDRFVISAENEARLIEGAAPHRPVYVFGLYRKMPLPYEEARGLSGSYDKVYKVIPP